MHRRFRFVHLSSIVITTLCLNACSGGRVIFDGDPVEHATVTYRNCDGDTWTTQTNGHGYYLFNPYDEDSPEFHTEDYIPAGVYLASASLGPWRVSNMVSHSYDETCEIEYDDELQMLPCTRRDFDLGFRPMAPWEHNAKLEAQKQHNDLQSYSFNIEYCLRFGGD